MKVSEASADELNRFNANVFEPKPAMPKNYGLLDVYPLGNCGVWFVVSIYDESDIPRIVPLDFINSGDGLKMMLERFPSIELRTYSGVWSARRDAAVTTVADTLGRAVAEAFALDNGWKE